MSAVARDADVYRKNDYVSSWLRAIQSNGNKNGPHANSCRTAALCHEISNRKNRLHIDKSRYIRCDTHDDAIGARSFSGTAVTAGC